MRAIETCILRCYITIGLQCQACNRFFAETLSGRATGMHKERTLISDDSECACDMKINEQTTFSPPTIFVDMRMHIQRTVPPVVHLYFTVRFVRRTQASSTSQRCASSWLSAVALSTGKPPSVASSRRRRPVCARTQRMSPWHTTLWLAPGASAPSGASRPVYAASQPHRSRRRACRKGRGSRRAACGRCEGCGSKKLRYLPRASCAPARRDRATLDVNVDVPRINVRVRVRIRVWIGVRIRVRVRVGVRGRIRGRSESMAGSRISADVNVPSAAAAQRDGPAEAHRAAFGRHEFGRERAEVALRARQAAGQRLHAHLVTSGCRL